MPSKGKNKGKEKGVPKNDRFFVASHHEAARADVHFTTSDLGRKPISMLLTQSPPKRIQDKITWIETSYLASLSIPAFGSLLETNQNFQLSQIPLFASWQALFDQYCIYSAMVRFSVAIGGASPAAFGRITTAIDYDSGAAVGSSTALLGFNSADSSDVIIGKSYERFVRPCITTLATGGSSSSATGNTVTRSWIDSAFPSVPHFGVRCICDGNLNTVPLTLIILTTLQIGFRNSY